MKNKKCTLYLPLRYAGVQHLHTPVYTFSLYRFLIQLYWTTFGQYLSMCLCVNSLSNSCVYEMENRFRECLRYLSLSPLPAMPIHRAKGIASLYHYSILYVLFYMYLYIHIFPSIPYFSNQCLLYIYETWFPSLYVRIHAYMYRIIIGLLY